MVKYIVYSIFSLLFLLSIIPPSSSQQTYALNITVFSQLCLPPLPICSLANPQIWEPNGTPDETSTINIYSSSSIQLAIYPNTSLSLYKLSLFGYVGLLVYGDLSFGGNGSYASLIVCDFSYIQVDGG